MSRSLVALTLVILLAGSVTGCRSSTATVPGTSATDPFTVVVTNIDGPPVDVFINGSRTAEVACASGAILTVGSDGIPPLPWALDVRRRSGSDMAKFQVEGGVGQVLLI
ncbi:MAG: hypothetical protein ACRDGI_00080, partial [Candidatus Limnocylindrales bacterium]